MIFLQTFIRVKTPKFGRFSHCR